MEMKFINNSVDGETYSFNNRSPAFNALMPFEDLI